MYTSGHAAARYAAVSNATAEPKSIEYRAFSRANSLLAAADHDTPDRMVRLAEAVHFNSRLWTVLATDTAQDGNTQPDALRAGILSLALYVQRTGQAVLRGHASAAALIEINTTVMRGLRSEDL